MLYPIKLNPIYKYKIWGGSRLHTLYNRTLPYDKTGESWEISCREQDICTVQNGEYSGMPLNQLIEKMGKSLLGSAVMDNGRFPLLLKYLDVQTDLSVQVHPSQEYIKHYGEQGEEPKIEVWYVLHADPGAKIISGLKPGVTQDALAQAAEAHKIGEYLQEKSVSTGDVILIRPGSVHAACAGLFLFELQQSSDTTFRLYDYDRLEADGKPRRLDIEKSLRAIHYDSAPELIAKPEFLTDGYLYERRLAQCDKFVLDEITFEDSQNDLSTNGEFCILTCIKGQIYITTNVLDIKLETGESVLLPADLGTFTISGAGTLLRSAAISTPLKLQ